MNVSNFTNLLIISLDKINITDSDPPEFRKEVDEKTGKIYYRTTIALYNHPDANKVNSENITRCYLAALKAADLNEDVSTICLTNFEQMVLSIESSNAFKDTIQKEGLEGRLLARAMQRWVKSFQRSSQAKKYDELHHKIERLLSRAILPANDKETHDRIVEGIKNELK